IVIILAAPMSLAITQSVSTRVLYGTSRLRFFARLSLVEALINLVLSVILVQYCDLAGVALGTMVPNILMNLGLLAYVCHTFHVPIREYLLRSFLPPLAPALLLIAFWLAAVSWIDLSGWMNLLTTGGLGLACYFLIAIQREFGARRIFALRKTILRRLNNYPR